MKREEMKFIELKMMIINFLVEDKKVTEIFLDEWNEIQKYDFFELEGEEEMSFKSLLISVWLEDSAETEEFTDFIFKFFERHPSFAQNLYLKEMDRNFTRTYIKLKT